MEFDQRYLNDRLLKTLMLGIVEGKRQQGRRARRWIDDILMWFGQDIKGAIQMTEDRELWRQEGWRSPGSPMILVF